MSSDESHVKALAQRYLGAIYGPDAEDTFRQLVHPDVTAHIGVSAEATSAPPMKGIESFIERAGGLRAALPDAEVFVDHLVAEDDMVAAHLRVRGTHDGPLLGIEPTGREVEIESFALYRFEDDRIIEVWGNPNTLSLLEQLGVDVPTG